MNRISRPARVLGALAAGALTVGLLPAVAGAAPAAPTGLEPETAGDQRKNLELSWHAVSGAGSYEVQLSDDGDFERGKVLTATTTRTQWVVPVSLPRGDYAWRVRSKGAAGASGWSDAQFTRGWGDHPMAKSVTVAPFTQGLSFRWDPIPDASFYELEVYPAKPDGSSPFAPELDEYPPYAGSTLPHWTCYTSHAYFAPYGSVAGEENTPGNEANCFLAATAEGGVTSESDQSELGELIPPGTYFWRVRGRDGTVDGRPTPFAEPALSCTGVWYESGAQDTGDAVTVPIPQDPPVNAPTPECSRWSTVHDAPFTITAPAASPDRPGTPSGLRVEPTTGQPTAKVVDVTDTPVFRWNTVPGAAKYRVYVSRTTDFRDSDHVWETNATSLMPVGHFRDRSLKTYWTVQACSLDDLCSAVASRDEPYAFTKNAEVRVSTAKTTRVIDRQATLVWKTQFDDTRGAGQLVPRATEAKAYEVQVSSEGSWKDTVHRVTVDRVAGPTDTDHSRHTFDTSSLPDGTYVWRVRPIDEAGHVLKWSDAGEIVRDRAAPTARLGTRSGFGFAKPLVVKFSEPVDHVSEATVGIAVAGSGTRVEGTLTALRGNRWRFTPENRWVAGQRYRPWVDAAVVDRADKSVASVGKAVRASTTVDSASRALVKKAGDHRWWRRSVSEAIRKSAVVSYDRRATTPRSYVRTRVRTTRAALFACLSPRGGRAAVLVDGERVARVDLYSPYTTCRRVWRSDALADRVHTVKVVALGTKRAASRGYQVAVDAIRGS